MRNAGEGKVESGTLIEGRQWDRLVFSGEVGPVRQHKVEGLGWGLLERGFWGGGHGERTLGRELWGEGSREGVLGGDLEGCSMQWEWGSGE